MIFPTRRSVLTASAVAAILALGACETPSTSPAANAGATPASTANAQPATLNPTLASLSYAGSQQPVADLDRSIAEAGHDHPRLTAIATHLVALLRDPATTFAARQTICQRLGELPADVVLTDDSRPLFAAMLRDEKLVNLARLTLENMPGDAVDALYLDALSQPPGLARLAMIQSVGNRRLPAAVATLTPLLGDPDPAVAAAAAVALGHIATPASLTSLTSAPNPSAPAVVEAELVAADKIGGDQAIQIYNHLREDAQAPAPLRHAALHQLIVAQPDQAARRISETLSADDAGAKAVAIETVATLTAPGLAGQLGANLASWDAPTQVAVITALGRKGDAAAVPAVTAAASNSDPAIRAAALEALGFLPGTPETARLLAGIIVGDNSDDQKLARQSLARLNGPGVSAAIRDGAQTGDIPLRAVFIEQLALRHATEDLSLLLSMRRDPDPVVRAAALGALGDLAPGSDQAEILAWAREATDPTEQARALRALANVSLRIRDVATRARAVTDTIEHAETSVALRLLPVLPRIGGEASAASAARLALRNDPTLANAAVAALGRWSDSSGLDSLVDVAAKTSSDSIRKSATDAALRLLERDRSVESAKLGECVSRLLPQTAGDAARIRLVRLLGRCTDDASLAIAQKLTSEPALAAEAGDAVLAIQARRAGPPVATASEGWAATLLDGNPRTAWGVPATADQWIQVDFKAVRPVHQLTLDQSQHPDSYPERYEVFVTDDPQSPGAAVASGPGQSGKTVITLPAGTRGRYLIIRNTVERRNSWWGASDLLVD